MTATFFSWRETTSPDIESWKAKKFTYTWNGKRSTEAEAREIPAQTW